MLKRHAAGSLLGGFLASRGWVAQGAFVLVTLVVAVLAVPELHGVPFSQDRSVFRLVWLSCVPGALASGFLAPPGEIECSFPVRPLGLVRFRWVVSLALFPVAVHAAAQVMLGGFQPWVSAWFLRNHLLMLSISLIAGSVAWPSVAWAPSCVYVLVCWFLGTRDAFGGAWWWAVPNHLPDRPVGWVLAVVAFGWAAARQLSKPARC
ncbi:MAG: hypothetical protein LBJ02_02375 [Bifidobacteriaceae bacterium]|jgi:hypothetical protein|nr:hypothetical protein [Bifidobacteriaceae bacterium]